VADFARDVLEQPLDPWEQWAVIHAGELFPDGRPRFRTVLILVARQNGKTLLARTLTLFWLFVDRAPMVLGTSTNRDYAKREWVKVCETAQSNPVLARELGDKPVRRAIGEESLTTSAGAEYKFAATNRRAGRSLTVHRLLLDELREHASWDAYNAAVFAMNAVPDAQTVAITNQGDDSSVVLDALRGPALAYIETGLGDPRVGLLEWSAPRGADPCDVEALAMANPNLGRRIDPDALLGAAMRAKAAGGEELASFRTEVMCMRVPNLDPAVDPDGWDRCGTDDPLDLAGHRRAVALCLDVSMSGDHATLAAAAVVDGAVHVEIIEAWDGYGCTAALREDLPVLVGVIRPRALGWFPAGPAAAVAAQVADRGRRGWPPRRVTVQEITGEATTVCMALAELVDSGQLRHPRDPVLDQQAAAAQRLWQGDRWRFTRRGTTGVDAMYAVAGAAELARTLPPAPPPLEIV
jgi:hypothetical protein